MFLKMFLKLECTDPEYKNSGLLTCSTDIYSFGVVMLQVLSGTKISHIDEEDRHILLTKLKCNRLLLVHRALMFL